MARNRGLSCKHGPGREGVLMRGAHCCVPHAGQRSLGGHMESWLHPDSEGHHRRGSLRLAHFPHFTPRWAPRAELVAPWWVRQREGRLLCISSTHPGLLLSLFIHWREEPDSRGQRGLQRQPPHSDPPTAPLASHTTCDRELTPSPASLAAEQSPSLALLLPRAQPITLGVSISTCGFEEDTDICSP